MDSSLKPVQADPYYFFGNSRAGLAARAKDWTQTPLGPPESWPNELKTILAVMLNSPQAQCLFWGQELTYFYNDGYIQILTEKKHPDSMGAPGKKVRAESWSVIESQIQGALKDKKTSWFENQHIPLLNEKGELREAYFTYGCTPVLLQDGTVGGALYTTFETTNQVLHHKALIRSEQEMVDVIESMSDAFISVDQNWTITRINAHREKVTVFKRKDQIGKNFLELFFSAEESRQSRYWVNYHKAMKERVPVYFEEYYPPFDLWTLVRAYPTPDGGLAVFFTDTTKEKRILENLELAKENAENLALELNQSLQTRDEFISLASHELKTPLTTLKLQSEMVRRLLDRKDPRALLQETIERFASQSEKQISRLSRLVDEMLDVSRIRTGSLTLVRQTVNVPKLLQQVFTSMLPAFEADHFPAPTLELCEDFNANIDALRIEQVILNLLTNALRYGRRKPVAVRLKQNQENFSIEVRDQGIGIAPENLDKIFLRFERVGDAPGVSGLGLGLYLTRQIAVAHAGEIRVQSELGQGSCFTLFLPKN